MAIKTFKPRTPSSRGLAIVDRSALSKSRPVKKLTSGKKRTGGRNNLGRITSWHRGGGHKKLYRLIDFKRSKKDIPAIVEKIEYDPNRSSFIALIKYSDGVQSYIIAPEGIKSGDKVVSSSDKALDIQNGNAMALKHIPIGLQIHNIEMKPGKGGQLVRSAGGSAELIGKDSGNALLKLRSGEVRVVHLDCMATIGSVSNPDHKNISIGKAGRSRWLGRRPVVRGVAMNPVDHPHGGGEGKTSGGRHPVTPWGFLTKGKKTRSNKRTSKFIIRRKTKR